ncbi:hypothetical protein U0070_016263, partial [Myodes glareolus]
VSRFKKVEEHLPTLRVQEGASAVVTCRYVHRHEKHPKLTIDIHSNMERNLDQELIVFLDKKAKHLPRTSQTSSLKTLHVLLCCKGTLIARHLQSVLKYSRGSNGESVTQTNVMVTITEGFPVLLNCTYQTLYSDSYLWWYVQFTNRAPQLLLRSSTDNKRTENHGFHATLHKINSSFHLQKSSVQLSDSALYYCALSD